MTNISSCEVKIVYFILGFATHELYTMHNKFSNCFVWVIPPTSDLKFHLLS